MTDVEPRIVRIEAKQEALDTYLPALLNAMERSQARIEDSVRFTRLERWALIVAIAAIPISILVGAIG